MKFYAVQERPDKSIRIFHFTCKKDRDEWINEEHNRRLLTLNEYNKLQKQNKYK